MQTPRSTSGATRRAADLQQAAWAAVSTATGVLSVAQLHSSGGGALEGWHVAEAAMLGLNAVVMLLAGARVSPAAAGAAALSAGTGALLGGEVVARWGWDFTTVDGLVPNLCAHRVQHAVWIALVACAAAGIAFAAGVLGRNPIAATAAGAFGAPLIVWWTHTAVAYGCG
jgi:hypothetical protein